MLASSLPTSPPSVRNLGQPLVALAGATPSDRWLASALRGIGVPWLAYTRLYFFLQPRHLTN